MRVGSETRYFRIRETETGTILLDGIQVTRRSRLRRLESLQPTDVRADRYHWCDQRRRLDKRWRYRRPMGTCSNVPGLGTGARTRPGPRLDGAIRRACRRALDTRRVRCGRGAPGDWPPSGGPCRGEHDWTETTCLGSRRAWRFCRSYLIHRCRLGGWLRACHRHLHR